MLIVVEFPEVQETFQFDLEDSATIAQLKSELDEQNRKFSVRTYDVSKTAQKLRLITDSNFEAKVF